MSAKADVPGSEVATNPASRLYWGPRLWRVFHLLAEVSNRRDMYMLWVNILRMTAGIVPCDQCRTHIASYVTTHAFMRSARPHLITGEAVRTLAREDFREFHNAVNERLGKPQVTREQYAVLYPKTSRPAVLAEIGKLMEEIHAAWAPLIHGSINGAQYTNWKKHISLMLALAAGGPSA